MTREEAIKIAREEYERMRADELNALRRREDEACAKDSEIRSLLNARAALPMRALRLAMSNPEGAKAVSEKHGFGVYIITVDSFRDVTDSYDVFDGAATLYNKYALGFDADQKGVLLLLSMEERDFSLVTHGDYGEYVFDQDTREAMTDYFLDDFSYDAWYDGFADYLSVSNDVLTDGPDKLQSEINALTGMIFLVPLIPAAIGVFILGRKMKSVAAATQAEAYVSGVPELTVSEDRYTHTTEVRRKIKDEDSDQSSGGGVRSRSSGSFSGTSGKF